MKQRRSFIVTALLLAGLNTFSQNQQQKTMKPFKIEISESVLTDLQSRLKATRWTDEPENAGWNYGTNPAYLRALVDYWQTKYDWRKHEAELNKFNHYKATIDGVEIHFIYEKGKGKNPKPLILTHGWPDSFYRFHKAIPMLTDPAKFGRSADESFDVVIPSIPGFGFSQHIALNDDKIASIWSKLMKEVLGYQKFFAAGGDIGSGVTKALATNYPESVSAIHLTDVGYPSGTEDWSSMSAEEQQFGQYSQQWFYTEGAYIMLQSTKPQTLGYALNDSPVGLASWILEKFNAWRDQREDLEKSYTKDELLTNIMIYWVTQTINSSMRTYLENARASYGEYGPKPVQKVMTPTGVAVFPGDANFPKAWADRMVNVQRFSNMNSGGHFAALDVPELWVSELATFFKKY
jgi:pimeloyl-ACP methyl ester carboxylesterase